MPAMPRKDSSKPDPFAALTSDSEVEREETPVEDEAPDNVVRVEDVPEPKRGSVQVAFDPSFHIADGISEVSVSVAGSEIHALKTDGTPIEISSDEAELLLQSPAVKEAK